MKKILIIETSPTIISVSDSLLRQKGYDVTCLSNGIEAFNFAKAEQPDLIISGLSLIEINGIELCRKIASDSQTGGIPIVLMIGEHDDVYANQIDVCGARGRLKKPFSPKELLAIVEKFAGAGGAINVTRIVDQNAEDAPKLRAQDINSPEPKAGFGADARPNEENIGSPFNLEWDDLKGDEGTTKEPNVKLDFDDTGLVIDDDQYGLTAYSDPSSIARRKMQNEDYDWFIDEMKREIQPSENPAALGKVPSPTKRKPSPAADVSYQNVGKPISEDEGKYRRFLDDFKKDTGILTQNQPGTISPTDLNMLADIIAEKLARKIVEKINKEEIKQVILSVFSSKK